MNKKHQSTNHIDDTEQSGHKLQPEKKKRKFGVIESDEARKETWTAKNKVNTTASSTLAKWLTDVSTDVTVDQSTVDMPQNYQFIFKDDSISTYFREMTDVPMMLKYLNIILRSVLPQHITHQSTWINDHRRTLFNQLRFNVGCIFKTTHNVRTYC